MLRITNSMMVNNLKRSINTNLLNMDNLQQQLSSGKKINKPSDDPAGLVKALRLRTNLTESAQYKININEASSFLQTTDDALNMINEITQKIRELTVKAATSTNTDNESKLAIAKEINELNEQLKLVANAAYGTKYIFAGTNVTQAPVQGENWLGNEELMELEIGVGVKIPVNLQTRDFFMGRLNNLNIAPSSQIQSIQARKLQEGNYVINTKVGPAADAKAIESQSYLSSINNNDMFFFQNASTPAVLGAGSDPLALANDSNYNASLMLEVKKVKPGVPPGGPRAEMTGTVLDFNKALYTKNADGLLVPLANGDISTPVPPETVPNFTYTQAYGSTAALIDATYEDTGHTVTFNLSGAPAAGDTIIWNNDVGGVGGNKLYDADGNEYTPVKAVFDGTDWVYDDVARVTVDIKGHVYDAATGAYTYVERKNQIINMETADGQELFQISANPQSGDMGTLTAPIVIWNNSGAALGSIDPTNPQIAVGDKTVISTAAQGNADAEILEIAATYLDKNGNEMKPRNHNFSFSDGYFDNNSRDLQFFTLNEQTGLTYSGTMNLTTDDFTATDASEDPWSFDYKAGLFEFVDDLSRKIIAGKLPQVGNELAGHDSRLQDLLLYRSTIGARINRLELQTNRLTSTEESLTTLLSNTEDANEAEVIMNLKLQENVYNAALAAGARIIQPTLMDFLR